MDKNSPPAVPALTLSTALSQACAHWDAGQAAHAEQLCLRVLEVAPDHPGARHLLGLMAHAYGRLDAGIEHMRAACRSPLAPGACYSNLAEMCRQKGLLDEAETAARRAVALEPQSVEGWNNLGIILQESGQLAASLECLQRVAALLPDSPEVHNNLGNTCKRLGDNTQALAYYGRALALNPDYAQALCNQSLALSDDGRHEEAVAAIRRAIDLDPLMPNGHQILARVELARDTTKAEGVPADPETIARWRLAAQTLRSQGRVDDACAMLERIVRAVPGDAGARFNWAEMLLLQGDFEAGWREYRFRYRMAHTAMRERHVQKPRWAGQFIEGKTLLIHDEQGYGDTFQFLQLVAWARERSGARVVLEINADIHALAKRGEGFDEIIRAGTIPPAFDFHCELMSLPLALGLRLSDLPARTAYLRADPPRVEFWRKRLAALPRPWVGLVWAGRPSHPNDAQRSLSLADLAPLAQHGMTFIALQKGDAAAQAATPPPGMAMVSLSNDIHDFDDTAALLTLLDVLVSVDSSPAHLAGALGCPVWVMLPFEPDWRWLRERADTPWYPSMRLFRQPAPQAWAPVLGDVAGALSGLSTRG
ncbi:tetratricopeptide repeat protein [Achromobacter marplatensis]|uniref:tetratricopeptide repeat protein n=1 Tax=Achromobacter marplatensis TaxID=470868 RepID=UPI0039F6FDDE